MPFAHNPTIHNASDGTYIIYHIGSGRTTSGRPIITNCTNGTTPTSCADTVCGTMGTGTGTVRADELVPMAGIADTIAPSMLVAKSLDGPWTVYNNSATGTRTCPSITNYKSKWGNIWIGDVFLLSDPSTLGAGCPQPKYVSKSMINKMESSLKKLNPHFFYH